MFFLISDDSIIDYGDCCDDIADVCPQFFRPLTEEGDPTWTIEWPSDKPTSTVFIAGLGKTQDRIPEPKKFFVQEISEPSIG